MPNITITNTSSNQIYLADLYTSLGSEDSIEVYRSAADLSRMTDLQTWVTAGTVTVAYTYTVDEIGSNLVTFVGGTPAPSYDAQVIEIYARSTGSDTTGTGALAAPYATLVRAVKDVPLNIGAGTRYVVDITGVTETLPANYTLPAWKAPWSTGIVTAGSDSLFTTAVTIQATPEALQSISLSDATINSGDIASQAAGNTVDGYIVLTLNVARASWSSNALKGALFIAGNTGGAQCCVVVASTNTTVTLNVTSSITELPAMISQPGATLTGTVSGSASDPGGAAYGMLRAINCDSIMFSGLSIANTTATSPGLAIGGNGAGIAQCCWLTSPNIQASSPAMTRVARSWVTHVPAYRVAGGTLTFQSALHDTCTSLTFLGTGHVQFRSTANVGCATIQANSGDPAGPSGNDAFSPMVWEMTNTLIENGTSYGFYFSGGHAQLKNVNVYGCGNDGIHCANGGGWMHLDTVGSTSTANTGYGINVQDGIRVAANSATYTNSSLLAGTTSAILVGNLSAMSWATWITNGDLAWDITAVSNSTGATGTGSALYGD